MTVSQQIILTGEEYRALAAIATERGVHVHVLIERLIRAALRLPEPLILASKPKPKPKPKKPPRIQPPYVPKRIHVDEAELRRLHAEKLTDAEIGDRLGRTAQQIFYDRKFLGLMKNKQYRPRYDPGA